MTSFFDKLSDKLNGTRRAAFGLRPPERSAPSAAAKSAAKPVDEEELLDRQRLAIDIYQNIAEVTIYALAAGVEPEDFDITLDDESDVLTIRGVRKRPAVKIAKAEDLGGRQASAADLEGKFIQQECVWEPFFRKVILPAEVDPVKAQAVFKKGVLIISLPILQVGVGRKLPVVEVLTTKQP